MGTYRFDFLVSIEVAHEIDNLTPSHDDALEDVRVILESSAAHLDSKYRVVEWLVEEKRPSEVIE